MTTQATVQPRKTALNATHRRLGAKMVNFGGWDMPLEYSGILAEHEAVRTRAGLFDVSHMGETEIRGTGALALAVGEPGGFSVVFAGMVGLVTAFYDSSVQSCESARSQ